MSIGEAAKPSLTKVSLKLSGFAVFKTFPFRSCQSVKIGGGLARNFRFQAPTCLLLSLWLSDFLWLRPFMGEAAKPFLFEVVKVSKLEEVSHEMLAFKLPHVSS